MGTLDAPCKKKSSNNNPNIKKVTLTMFWDSKGPTPEY
jgi:hypothetical protein